MCTYAYMHIHMYTDTLCIYMQPYTCLNIYYIKVLAMLVFCCSFSFFFHFARIDYIHIYKYKSLIYFQLAAGVAVPCTSVAAPHAEAC